MNKNKKIELILDYVNSLFPNASCELNYTNDYEFVIAVMLSAQTTDKAVNNVTAKLFKKYPDLNSLANASLDEVSDCIREIGMFKVKAKNVILIAQHIINKFNGKVPKEKELLMTLPGVGNKTAGVVRAELFQGEEFPVDTHVMRISKRLGLCKLKDEPYDIEQKLKKIIDKSLWVKSHHQFIHFGRYFCTAKKPHCNECKLKDICKEFKN